MTVTACDRCTALGQQDLCESKVLVKTISVAHVRLADWLVGYTTPEEIVSATENVHWSRWTEVEYGVEATYCATHVRYCDWHGEWYAIPVLGHEYRFTDAFMSAYRHRAGVRHWGLSYLQDAEDPRSYYNINDMANDVCQNCYESGNNCDECGDRYPEDSDMLTSIGDGDSLVCENCLDGYSYCDDHDIWHHEWSTCSRCEYDEQRGGGYIHNYGYRPDPQFYVVPEQRDNWLKREFHDLNFWRRFSKYHLAESGTLVPVNNRANPVVFMGFELEVEAAHGNLTEGARLVGENWEQFLYLKQDGSLNHGMEIVSHPMTLRAHKELLDWSFTDKLSELGFLSYRTNTCGLHIHVNRASFNSDTHVYKFARLFADNPAPMQRLGGRNSSRWGTFENLGAVIAASVKNNYASQRYQAINFNNNTTLELRFFKGTLRTKRIHSALELVDAAVEYTRQLETRTIIEQKGFSFTSFADWVSDKSEYANLTYFINTFGLRGPANSTWDDHDISNEMEV